MITEVVNSSELHKIDPVFGQLSFDNHEQIVFCNDKDTGLKAIIGIHNTVLGPALGGTRMWKYTNEWEALNDVLRLSRGMTFKSAISGLNLGGGKAVIIGDSKVDKTPEHGVENQQGKNSTVVQKHAASHLLYDFHLEMCKAREETRRGRM